MFKIDSGIVGFIEDFGLKGVAALRQETKLNKKAEYSIGYEEERQSPCVTSVIKYKTTDDTDDASRRDRIFFL